MTVLLLSDLRADIGTNLGEGDCLGTVTGLSGPNPIDNQRFDGTEFWDGGFFQDITTPGGALARINSWQQSNNTFTLYNNLSALVAGHSYEVHKRLSFSELRRAINRGIALCGKYLRVVVRDESQAVQPMNYQVTPNYAFASPNCFWTRGVQQVSVMVDVGIPTATWQVISRGTPDGWNYLDDKTIQLPRWAVDGYQSNALRFVGYGPLVARLTTDDPAQVLADFDQEFQIEMLTWACTAEAWGIAAARKTSGESKVERENQQAALQQFDLARKAWYAREEIKPQVVVPTGAGWTAGNY